MVLPCKVVRRYTSYCYSVIAINDITYIMSLCKTRPKEIQLQPHQQGVRMCVHIKEMRAKA